MIAPTLSTTTANGITLVLSYDEALDGTSQPANSTFEVTAGNETKEVSLVSVSVREVTLTLVSGVSFSDEVTVSYEVPSAASDARIQDISGNAAASFSDVTATNATRSPDNRPAVGAPYIVGSPQVDINSWASMSRVADADGMSGATFSYQWVSNDGSVDTDIPGATGYRYSVQSSDIGKRIRVRVSFTDDAGNLETLISPLVGPVRHRVAPPRDVKVVEGDEKLGVTWKDPVNEDRTVSLLWFEVSWQDPDGNWSKSGHLMGLSYMITDLANGEEIGVRVEAAYSDGRKPGSPRVTGTPGQGTPPEPTSARVAAATLLISYDRRLDTNSVPTEKAFTVSAGDLSINVSAVEFRERIVQLTLASSVTSKSTVKLSYSAPTGANDTPIRDWVGNAASSITDHEVTNASDLTSDSSLSVLDFPNVTSTPTFSSGRYSYSASVPNDVTSVTIKPTLNNASSTLEFDPSSDEDETADGHQVALGVGENVIKIRVIAENGVDENTYTLDVTRASGVPEAPINVYLSGWDDGELTIGWKPPLLDGGSEITGYRVQWRSGSKQWDSVRQSELLDHVPDDERNGFPIKHTITGLTNGVEYTVRVLAYNEHGAGHPSFEFEAVPSSLQDELRDRIENNILGRYGDSSPWLRQVWNHLKSLGLEFEVREYVPAGIARVFSDCNIRVGVFPACKVIAVAIEKWQVMYAADASLSKVIIHEMGHVHDRSTALSGKPELGVLYLHLKSLNAPCPVSELYADILTLTVNEDAPVSYWNRCIGVASDVRSEALSVARAALSGNMPSWLASTYNDAKGDLDLERLWADVKQQRETVFRFRNSFGGYCDDAIAVASASEDGVARNPWRDGGCVPRSPGSVVIAPAGSGQLAISWVAPEYDGGSPIEGYRIQWKSSSQEYAESRQAEVAYKDHDTSHTVGGLSNGVEYSVRIAAYSQNGDGAYSGDVMATTTEVDSAAPVLLSAIVARDELSLIYNEELDGTSEPATTSFAVSVSGSLEDVAGVTVADNEVTLTLTVSVVSSAVVSIDYTSTSTPIQDTSGNDAPDFSGRAVLNETRPPSKDATLRRLEVKYGDKTTYHGTINLGVKEFRQRVGSVATSTVEVQPSDKNAQVVFEHINTVSTETYDAPNGNRNPTWPTHAGLIDLSMGENVVTITVTAEDDMTTETYTVTIVREPDG